jgi:Tol biopolymer transport system component
LTAGPVTPTAAFTRIGSPTRLIVDADGKPDSEGVADAGGGLISGDGRYVFFITSNRSNLATPEVAGMSGTEYMFRRDLETGEITVVSRGPDGHTPVGVSPPRAWLYGEYTNMGTTYDGSVIAFEVFDPSGGTPGSPLYINNTNTHTSWKVGDTLSDTAGAPRISDDGQRVVYATSNNASMRNVWIQRQGAAPQLITTACDLTTTTGCLGDNSTFDTSRDAGKIAWSGYAADNKVHAYVYDVTTGGTTDLLRSTGNRVSFEGLRISGDGKTAAVGYCEKDTSSNVIAGGLAVKQIGSGGIGPADVKVPDIACSIYALSVTDHGEKVGYGEDKCDLQSGFCSFSHFLSLYNTIAAASDRVAEAPDDNTHIGPMKVSGDGRLAAWDGYDKNQNLTVYGQRYG